MCSLTRVCVFSLSLPVLPLGEGLKTVISNVLLSVLGFGFVCFGGNVNSGPATLSWLTAEVSTSQSEFGVSHHPIICLLALPPSSPISSAPRL